MRVARYRKTTRVDSTAANMRKAGTFPELPDLSDIVISAFPSHLSEPYAAAGIFEGIRHVRFQQIVIESGEPPVVEKDDLERSVVLEEGAQKVVLVP